MKNSEKFADILGFATKIEEFSIHTDVFVSMSFNIKSYINNVATLMLFNVYKSVLDLLIYFRHFRSICPDS